MLSRKTGFCKFCLISFRYIELALHNIGLLQVFLSVSDDNTFVRLIYLHTH